MPSRARAGLPAPFRLRRHQITRHQDVLVEVGEGHLDLFLTDCDDRGLVLGFVLVVLLAVGEVGVPRGSWPQGFGDYPPGYNLP